MMAAWLRRAVVLLALWAPSTPAAAAPVTNAPRAERLAPLSVAGAPRSLVTLVVAVPAVLEDAASIRFEVHLSGAVDVLGRLEGTLDGPAATRRRPVLLTLRVPSTALVGLMDVADVVFVADDGRTAIVPIILRVPAVQAIHVAGTRELVDLERGDRVELVYRIQNLGNASETLAIDVSAPSSWSVRTEGSSPVTVPAYGTREVILSLRIPPTPNAGSFGVEMGLRRARGDDSTVVASARTVLRVKEFEPRRTGVVARPFLAAATSGDGAGLATGIRIGGPVSERVSVYAEYTPTPRVQGLGVLGLSSVGAARAPFTAAVFTDAWRVDVGNAQASFGDLTGLNFLGRGVAASYRGEVGEGVVVAARPAAEFGGEGHFVGAGSWWNTRLGRIGASVSSLREAQLGGVAAGRELNALGGDWVSRAFGASVVSAGLAVRDAGDGPALGYRVQFLRDGARDRVRMGILHAPGGARAFAAAASQYVVEARRELTERLMVDANAQLTTDGGDFVSTSEVRTLSLGGRFQWTPATAVGLRVSEDANDVRSSALGAAGFGATQRALIASGETELGDWRLGVEGQVGQVERRSVLLSGTALRRAAMQHGATVSAIRPLEQLGALALGATLSETGAGVGTPAGLLSTYLRWSDVPIAVNGEVVRLESEVRMMRSELNRAQFSFRAGLATAMRSGLEIAASVERNPFIRDSRGRQTWLAAIRVGVSASVLTSTQLERTGVVFLDVNGNGRRDEGEAGAPGVVLRYDNARFVTTRRGEYKIPRSLRGRLRVDPSSIPAGFVTHPRMAADSLERREIPLVPTGSVAIALRLELDADGRVPNVALGNGDVWLRDADGFEWVGRSEGDGRFVFEHVPVGPYTVRIDLSRLGEPVRAEEPAFVLLPGENPEVAVPVRGRSVRTITPPRQGGRGGVAPRAGRRAQR